jgi:hypothetical protein
MLKNHKISAQQKALAVSSTLTLIQMKSFILIILLFFSFASNGQKAALKTERQAWGFKDWQKQFKDRAFCLCLLEGYQNQNVKNFILENDKSYYDPIGIAIFDTTLKQFISKEVEKINTRAKLSSQTVSEAAAGKRIFSHCLEFYKSKRLDSLTKQTAPSWKNINNIQEKIEKSVPAF